MRLLIKMATCLGLVLYISLYLISCSSNSPKKGIVVAVNDNYARTYFLASIDHLRNNLKCKLPIEIWYSGDELSPQTQKQLSQFSNVHFKDISSELNVDPQTYRGFQIKSKIIELSDFDDIILMDADVFFYEDPEILFEQPAYKQTGTFFFSDLGHEFPVRGDNLLFTLEKYLKRRDFIQSIVPIPSHFTLHDMKEMWTKNKPTFESPFIGDMQESGCVAFNKTKHINGLKCILELNDHRNHTYQFVYGDKETFWLGCERANEPYHINEQRPFTLLSGNQVVNIVQFLNNKMFYQQKNPIPVKNQGVFIKYARQFVVYIPGQEPSEIRIIRPLTDEEQTKIESALTVSNKYTRVH